MARVRPAEDRFWEKVEKTDGCWVWKAARDPLGYGRFYIEPGVNGPRLILAHRYSYRVAKGEPPPGLDLDHLCRNPSCVNPDHLEPVTRRENVMRGIRGNRTACKHGHAYTPENTYRQGKGGRRACVECRRLRQRLRRQALRNVA